MEFHLLLRVTISKKKEVIKEVYSKIFHSVRIAFLYLLGMLLLIASAVGCANGDRYEQTNVSESATFTVSDLSISPQEIEYLDVVTISVVVANTGDLQGSYDCVLYIDGLEEGVKCVTVAANSSECVTFYVNRIPHGTYNVTVGELEGSFSVVEPWPFGE
ncbi:MAG: hypothetical protein JSV32_03780 [Dehalococcoidia bacterium]|nr:MAG: hypothetical protein JSV32_03780 [Dehalococcoidia bacterium]